MFNTLFAQGGLTFDRPSPRFSRWPLKPGFAQINVTLDSAQGLVVDGLFVGLRRGKQDLHSLQHKSQTAMHHRCIYTHYTLIMVLAFAHFRVTGG